MPGLDGLRALAVIAVLIYHAEPGWLPGGFLGVDVFFVISGYIITAGLVAEWQSRGSIQLWRFWWRRARRLLPAVFFLIIAVLAIAVLFLPDEVVNLRQAALAAAVYCTNWFLIWDHQSYFETWLRPSLLRHLWSLAVEEQFYLIWPPLLAFVLLKLPRPLAVAVLIALAAASSLWMAYLYRDGAELSRLYYGTDTRAAGFLIGATLAILWRQPALHGLSRWRRRGIEAGGLAGLLLLCASLLWFGESQPILYQGGFAAVSIFTALVIVAAVTPAGKLARLAGKRPLVWIGVRSYSLYLWHWPVFMLTRPDLDVPLSGLPLLVLRFAACFVLAHISYQLIEQPFRNGSLGNLVNGLRRRGRFVAWAVGIPASATAVAAIMAVMISAGMAQSSALPSTVSSIRLVTLGADRQGQLPSAQLQQIYASLSPAETMLAPAEGADWYLLPTPTPEPTVEPSPAASTQISAQVTPVPGETSQNQQAQAPLPPPPPYLPDAILPPSVRLTVLGDSVLLGAAYEFVRLIPNLDFDAAVGRQAGTFVSILDDRRVTGALGDLVVVQVGNNGPVSRGQMQAIMDELQGVPRVVILNLTVPRSWQDSNNDLISQVVPQYGNAILVDWHSVSADRPDFFGSDGVHLTGTGARMLMSLVAEALTR